jgi:hypothetical protein
MGEVWLTPDETERLKAEVQRRVNEARAEGRKQGFEDAKAEILKRRPAPGTGDSPGASPQGSPYPAPGAPPREPPAAALFHKGSGVPYTPEELEPGSYEWVVTKSAEAGRQWRYRPHYRMPPMNPTSLAGNTALTGQPAPAPAQPVQEAEAIPLKLAEGETDGD